MSLAKRIRQIAQVFRYRKELRQAMAMHLSLLEGDGVADALGSLTDEETAGLRRWIADVPEGGVVLEFGTLFGLTTQQLACAAPKNVKIITVDNFCWNPFGLPPAHHEAFARRILAPWIASGRVELVAKPSRDFRAEYCGPRPDMLFLDADHSYEAVKEELLWAKGLDIPLVCGHDYGNPAFGVTRAVDELFPQGVETAGMAYRVHLKNEEQEPQP